MRWNGCGVADDRDKCFERIFQCKNSFVSAYMMNVNALIENNLEHAEIIYEDVFGEIYHKRYPIAAGHQGDPEKFVWEPPLALRLGI